MEPRLTRSNREVVVAGVCGGLAEYFHIDPVIVRLIFVLVTLTSGIGLLIYPVLWMIMPKPGGAPQLGTGDTPGAAWSRESREVVYREAAAGFARPADSESAGYTPPPGPEPMRFDPLTGEPLAPERTSTGQTINLRPDPSMPPIVMPDQRAAPGAQPAPPPRRRMNWAGVVLIGFGVLLLAEQFGIDADVVFPMIMIAIGALLVLRKR